jgi:cytochrome c556
MKRFIAFALILFASFFVIADENQVEYRQEVMSAIGSTMGAIGKILKQEVDRPDDLAPLAGALAELANTAQSVFPEGTEGGDALPEIWEESDDFTERLVALKETANAFRDVASTGDMSRIGPAVGELGQACRACHTSYRK